MLISGASVSVIRWAQRVLHETGSIGPRCYLAPMRFHSPRSDGKRPGAMATARRGWRWRDGAMNDGEITRDRARVSRDGHARQRRPALCSRLE